MTNDVTQPALRTDRDALVQRLCDHFACDGLTEVELERRLDLAYQARTREELDALARELPAPAARRDETLARRRALVDPALAAAAPASDYMVSIWGSTERKGAWVPARRLTTVSLMGGSEIDFRQAEFAGREVSVRLVAVMGGVDIIVPPGVRVEWAGIALMGGVGTPESSAPVSPEAPVIRVTGLVCLGAVDVVERLPGESAREARKRRKAARKARKRARRGR